MLRFSDAASEELRVLLSALDDIMELAFFLACYAISPLLTWDGPHCLLLGGAMMLTTVALWVHDMRLTRLLFLLNSPLVLLYNLAAGSYSCAAIEVVALASFALAVWRFDIHKQLCKS